MPQGPQCLLECLALRFGVKRGGGRGSFMLMLVIY